MKKMVVALVLIVAFAGVSITGMVMGDIKCGESSQTITLSLEKGISVKPTASSTEQHRRMGRDD